MCIISSKIVVEGTGARMENRPHIHHTHNSRLARVERHLCTHMTRTRTDRQGGREGGNKYGWMDGRVEVQKIKREVSQSVSQSVKSTHYAAACWSPNPTAAHAHCLTVHHTTHTPTLHLRTHPSMGRCRTGKLRCIHSYVKG